MFLVLAKIPLPDHPATFRYPPASQIGVIALQTHAMSAQVRENEVQGRFNRFRSQVEPSQKDPSIPCPVATGFEPKRNNGSSSCRKSPIYWYLRSAKGDYGLWLYFRRLDKDILFKALLNYVEPKIRLEEDRLKTLR
jgi:hypothetical protein